MLVIVDINKRIRGESRGEYLQRKFTEAYEKSIEEECAVTIRGYFYKSDLKIVNQITKGLEPVKKTPIKGSGYIASYLIYANAPHIPRPYEI